MLPRGLTSYDRILEVESGICGCRILTEDRILTETVIHTENISLPIIFCLCGRLKRPYRIETTQGNAVSTVRGPMAGDDAL